MKNIAQNVERRNPPNKSIHSFTSPQIHTAIGFSYKLIGNKIGSNTEKLQHIANYENFLVKLKLQLDAEEINDEVYELRNTEIKNQLLIKVWDISNTSKELVNKLFEIGVITEKQKNVAESNMEKNNEVKSKNELMMKEEFYYIDYILKFQ